MMDVISRTLLFNSYTELSHQEDGVCHGVVLSINLARVTKIVGPARYTPLYQLLMTVGGELVK